MLKLREALTKPIWSGVVQLQVQRCISALYITGDKAKENYATLQPYMDFEATFRQKPQLERSIAERQLPINLTDILEKYAKYKKASSGIKQLETQREAVTKKLRELTKSDPTSTAADCDRLKEEGRTLRNNLKQLKEHFYPIEDDFIHAYLDLPNALHEHCPSAADGCKLLYRSRGSAMPRSSNTSQNVETHLKHTELIHFVDNSRYYLMREAAEFDIECTHALTSYFVDVGHFTQTSNPDFVRCVLLEANATPLTQYHMVKEEAHHQQQNNLNSAFLTGGASFESYLGAVTKLCVYPSVLPLRYVGYGRLYHITNRASSQQVEDNLYSATQTNAVQTFVATTSASEADEELQTILNLAVDFYAALDVDFRIVYATAPQLLPSECLRAVIEVYSPAQQRYISVGHVSNYADFVSKRILFSMRQQKDYHFLHLVGGPILYTTRLIAALLEQGISLERCKLLGSDGAESPPQMTTAVEDFKNIFK